MNVDARPVAQQEEIKTSSHIGERFLSPYLYALVESVPISLAHSLFRSKYDIYAYFARNKQFYLPPYEHCPLGKLTLNV